MLAVGGGWLALRLTGSIAAVFAMLGLALIAYGAVVATAVGSGAWFGAPVGGFGPRALLARVRSAS